jgi:copper chaperone
MTTLQICVLNIKCGGCVNSIQTELAKINGVTNVVVSKEDGKVNISGVAFDRKFIVAKLLDMGYPEIGQKRF